MGRQKTEATKRTTLEYCQAVSRTVFLCEEKNSQKCAIRASIKRDSPSYVRDGQASGSNKQGSLTS